MRMIVLALAFTAVGAVIALVATVGLIAWEPWRSSGGQTVTGSIVLNVGFGPGRDDGEPCAGEGGYDDIRPGAEVTVRDRTGAIIATSRLDWGVVERIIEGDPDRFYCRLPFSVPDVPEADFYSIEVSRRGELTFSRDELEALDWQVAFELGP